MRFYTTIFFLLVFFSMSAQNEPAAQDSAYTESDDEKGPSFIAFSAGRTVVKGEFGAMSGKNASCALNGLGLSLEGAWYFSRNFGAAGKTGISFNPIDYESYYKNHVPPAPQGSVVRNGIDDTEVPYLMAGPAFAWIARKLVVDVHMLGGMMMMKKGRVYQLTGSFGGSPVYEYHERGFDGYSLCYGGGLGLRFELPARTLFQLRADYVSGAIKGRQRIDVISGGAERTTYEQLRRPVSFMYISAGFGYRFTVTHEEE